MKMSKRGWQMMMMMIFKCFCALVKVLCHSLFSFSHFKVHYKNEAYSPMDNHSFSVSMRLCDF